MFVPFYEVDIRKHEAFDSHIKMKDLKLIINPALLEQLGRARVPWPRTHHVSGKDIITNFITDEMPRLYPAFEPAWPALKAISRAYGPDTIPDMSQFLPPPESETFPQQAFGMHCLLDQCPRVLFKNVDGRWTSYFDKVTRKLYDFFFSLPGPLRPWSRERWPGATFEYWLCISWEFNATMAHQESTADHETMVLHAESLRLAVERYTGRRDPARDDERTKTDVFAFPRIVSNVDVGQEWLFHEAAFLCLEIEDVHKPIIDRYGRYPYRNAIEGRDSTDEEREWVEKTDHWAEASPDVAERVRKDVAAGIWTPLGRDDDNGLTSVIGIHARSALSVIVQCGNQ